MYASPAAASPRPHTPTSVGGSAYTYDNNSNLLGGGGRTYPWTSANLPATVTSGGVTETYSYDAEGSRIRRTRGSTTTAFIEGGIWDEIAGGGATTTSSMFNGSVLAQRTTSGSTSTVVYLHGDHPSAALRACIGSVSATTTSAGGILNRQEYDPWGAIRSGDLPETVRDFTGQRRDDTGFGSSYTDMGSGRFVSADGARQVRMGDSDILGHHGGGPHINFEDRIPNPMKPGKMMPTNNRHIYLEP